MAVRRTVHLSNGAFTVAVYPSRVACDCHDNITCARRHNAARERCRQILVVTTCRLILVLRRLCSRCDVHACRTGTVMSMICVIYRIYCCCAECRVSTASVKHCRRCAAVTLAPTLALTLHTSLRRSAAADSHLLQTGASCVCRSTACVDWSRLESVAVCEPVLSPDPSVCVRGREYVGTVSCPLN